jgi:alginate O-acetyltransferase complex protein AlgI
VPLGGNRKGRARTYINLMLVFLISGLWHGANWTYVAWGAAHGGLLIGEMGLRKVFPKRLSPGVAKLMKVLAGLLVFLLVCATWILFRAQSLGQALSFFETLFRWENAQIPLAMPGLHWPTAALGLLVLLVVDASNEFSQRFRRTLEINTPLVLRLAAVWLLVIWIAVYGVFEKQEFIYFKF